MDDYYQILKYKIITEKDLSIYTSVEEGLDKLLKKEITRASSYDDLIKHIKSKRYTYNKLQRMLLHILCNFTKEEKNNFNEITYIRILGLNNKGQKYLNNIKKDLDIPLISKIKKEKDPMLSFEIETSKIYALTLDENKQEDLIKQEYQRIIKGE